MPISNDYERLACSSIFIDRAARQRKLIDVEDLIPSIRGRGVMQPILVERNIEGLPDGFTVRLRAGERRLTASLALSLPDIPVRYMDELSPEEAQLIELEENVRRAELPWQDKALAMDRIHQIYRAREPDWEHEATAAHTGFSTDRVEKFLTVAEAIKTGNQAVIQADSMAAARTILARQNQRAQAEAINRIVGNDRVVVEAVAAGEAPRLDAQPEPAAPPLPEASPFRILHADAIKFFDEYDGPKFNFLHCDFPYGVVLHEQAGQDGFEGGGYESTPEIYWALCDALCSAWPRIMYPSCHLMFWISMEFYTETIEYFEARIPGLRLQRTPLVWLKTDNKGILSDAKRGPRRIYESALFGACDDRFIVRPISNGYPCPTEKSSDAIHTNQKPEPMLAHFLSMFVDEHTRMLDPTCGSGSAIRVAERLGAELALGLEHNEEFAKRAEQQLLTARNLRFLSEKASNANP